MKGSQLDLTLGASGGQGRGKAEMSERRAGFSHGSRIRGPVLTFHTSEMEAHHSCGKTRTRNLSP